MSSSKIPDCQQHPEGGEIRRHPPATTTQSVWWFFIYQNKNRRRRFLFFFLVSDLVLKKVFKNRYSSRRARKILRAVFLYGE